MTLYEQTKAFIKDVTNSALNSAKEKGEIDFSEVLTFNLSAYFRN